MKRWGAVLPAWGLVVCCLFAGWFGGGCGESAAPPDFHLLLASGGGDAAIAFGPDDSPRVVFVGVGGLKYAHQGKSGWVIRDLPATGSLPAMAVDSTGTPHITYYAGGSKMSYLTRGADGQWTSYPLDEMGGPGAYGKGEVNHHLRVDSQDRLHLLYYNDILPGRLVYGLFDQSGWRFTDIASGVTARNNWLDLNNNDEAFVGWYDTDRFVWARSSEGWVPHKLGLKNDAVTDQGHFCAMVVFDEATVVARFWGTYRWEDSYGNKYADDLFIQAVTPDGGTILLNNATLEPGELPYSPGPTLMYKNEKGGKASVSYRDGGLWGAFGGRIPVNLGHWAAAYGYALNFRTSEEAVVWVQEDGGFHFEGPDRPTEDKGGGGPWGGGSADHDAMSGDSALACEEPGEGEPPAWRQVGKPGFSAGEVYLASIAASDGIVWAAYRDSATGFRLTVQRYQDCHWTVVGGSGLSTGEVNIPPSLALYQGKAWVAYADAGLADSVIVKQYGGAGWLPLGGPYSLGKPSNEFALTVLNAIPHVAMARSDSFYRPSVMRFNTVEWEPLGDEFLSDVGTQAVELFVFEGYIGVAFADGNHANAATAKQFDAAQKEWQGIGPEGVTPGNSTPLSVAAGGGKVWMVFADSTANSMASAMVWSGSEWQPAGASGFSTDAVKSLSLGVGPDGVPYLALESIQGKAEVLTFDGTNWIPLGEDPADLSLADEPTLHVAPDGTVFVAYSDQGANERLSAISYR